MNCEFCGEDSMMGNTCISCGRMTNIMSFVRSAVSINNFRRPVFQYVRTTRFKALCNTRKIEKNIKIILIENFIHLEQAWNAYKPKINRKYFLNLRVVLFLLVKTLIPDSPILDIRPLKDTTRLEAQIAIFNTLKSLLYTPFSLNVDKLRHQGPILSCPPIMVRKKAPVEKLCAPIRVDESKNMTLEDCFAIFDTI